MEEINNVLIEPQALCDELYHLAQDIHFCRDSQRSGLESKFNSMFGDLYNISANTNFLWKYCPFKVYESHFEDLRKKFFEKFPDSEELDFLNSEIEKYESCFFSESDVNPLVSKKDNEVQMEANFLGSVGVILENTLGLVEMKNVKYTQKRKLTFLRSKLPADKLKKELESDNVGTDVDECSDFSENGHPERFVMMHELGILDFLKGKVPGISQRKMASLLSSISGINQENLRKMINGTANGDNNNKLTEKNINAVHARLVELGLKPDMFK